MSVAITGSSRKAIHLAFTFPTTVSQSSHLCIITMGQSSVKPSRTTNKRPAHKFDEGGLSEVDLGATIKELYSDASDTRYPHLWAKNTVPAAGSQIFSHKIYPHNTTDDYYEDGTINVRSAQLITATTSSQDFVGGVSRSKYTNRSRPLPRGTQMPRRRPVPSDSIGTSSHAPRRYDTSLEDDRTKLRGSDVYSIEFGDNPVEVDEAYNTQDHAVLGESGINTQWISNGSLSGPPCKHTGYDDHSCRR